MTSNPDLERWVREQQNVARALGLPIEAWADELDSAAARRTELMAAVIGAASAQGRGLTGVARVDGPSLARRARALLGVPAVRVEHPVLIEAVRRGVGPKRNAGRARLRGDETVSTPRRGDSSIGPSAPGATADAPGGRSGKD